MHIYKESVVALAANSFYYLVSVVIVYTKIFEK